MADPQTPSSALEERLQQLETENAAFREALRPSQYDFVSGDWDKLNLAGINVFAVTLLVESIERQREALSTKCLVIPAMDHLGAVGYVTLSPNFPALLDEHHDQKEQIAALLQEREEQGREIEHLESGLEWALNKAEEQGRRVAELEVILAEFEEVTNPRLYQIDDQDPSAYVHLSGGRILGQAMPRFFEYRRRRAALRSRAQGVSGA